MTKQGKGEGFVLAFDITMKETWSPWEGKGADLEERERSWRYGGWGRQSDRMIELEEVFKMDLVRLSHFIDKETGF